MNEHYQRLAYLKLRIERFETKLNEITDQCHNLVNIANDAIDLFLRSNGKRRFLRTTRELSLQAVSFYSYHFNEIMKDITFPKGTLIQSSSIHLDINGGACVDFPEDALEEVFLSDDEIDWNLVKGD